MAFDEGWNMHGEWFPNLAVVAPHQENLIIGDGPARTISGDANHRHIYVAEGGVLSIGHNAMLRCASLIVDGTVEFLGDHGMIVARDIPLDPGVDPNLTQGFIWRKGSLIGRGVQNDPWKYAVGNLNAGDTEIIFETPPALWKTGDYIRIPDTRHLDIWTGVRGKSPYVDKSEVVQIKSVDQERVTLIEPLKHTHPRGEYTPVAVSSRDCSIAFCSENPQGTRGHVMFMGRSDIQADRIASINMGRTQINPQNGKTFTDLPNNVAGRYPWHLHHHVGPDDSSANWANNNDKYGFDFQSKHRGITVYNTEPFNQKGGIVIHGSGYSRIEDCAVESVGGVGIACEDGREYGYRISNNMVSGVWTPRSGLYHKEMKKHFDNGGSEFFWFDGGNGFTIRNLSGEVVGNTAQGVNPREHCYGFNWFFRQSLDDAARSKRGSMELETLTRRARLGPQEFAQDDNRSLGLVSNGHGIWDRGVVEKNFGAVPSRANLDLVSDHHWNAGAFLYSCWNVGVDIDGSGAPSQNDSRKNEAVLVVADNREVRDITIWPECKNQATGIAVEFPTNIRIGGGSIEANTGAYFGPASSVQEGVYDQPLVWEFDDTTFNLINLKDPSTFKWDSYPGNARVNHLQQRIVSVKFDDGQIRRWYRPEQDPDKWVPVDKRSSTGKPQTGVAEWIAEQAPAEHQQKDAETGKITHVTNQFAHDWVTAHPEDRAVCAPRYGAMTPPDAHAVDGWPGLWEDVADWPVPIPVPGAPEPPEQELVLPSLSDDTATCLTGETIEVDVLSNDTQGTYPIDPESIDIVTAPYSGQASASMGKVVFKAGDSAGEPTISYTVKDTEGNLSNVGNVFVKVEARGEVAPVAGDRSVEAVSGDDAIIDVRPYITEGSSPVNADSLVVAGSAYARVEGIFIRYVVTNTTEDYTDTFTYTVADVNGLRSNPGTITVNVTGREQTCEEKLAEAEARRVAAAAQVDDLGDAVAVLRAEVSIRNAKIDARDAKIVNLATDKGLLAVEVSRLNEVAAELRARQRDMQQAIERAHGDLSPYVESD